MFTEMSMKRVATLIFIISVVGVLFCCSSCTQISSGKQEAFNPTVALTGDVEDMTTYSFIDSLSNSKMASVDFSLLYSSVVPVGEIEGAFILTHSAKCVYINVESFPYYYLVANSSGVVSAHSRLESHNAVCELPLISVDEIVFVAKEPTEANMLCVYSDRTATLGLKSTFKVFGFIHQTVETVEAEKYIASACNFSAVPVTSFLLGRETITLKTKNGASIEVNRISKQQIRWHRGAFCLDTDEYGTNPIVEIDYLE